MPAVATETITTAQSSEVTEAELCGWQRQVDALCDRFEDAWDEEEKPRIEDYLATSELPASRQPALLCELLKLERELRQQRDDSPTASQYLERFPGHANVVRAVFGESRLGPYELLGLIGEGGMGSVYRAYDPAMRRTVALKVIRANRLDDSAAPIRFRLEAQLTAQLDHEHIVPVFEAGQEGSQLFYTMRYIQGRNLAEVIDKKPLENHRAAHYIEQVARAVEHAHGQMILHRDLKPSNILIDSSDRAYVTDFGLAKVLDQTESIRTVSSDRLGTLAYMAPEQARNPARAVIESDVYSLGATLYEALTGRTPFQADSLLATLDLLEKQEPVPPRRLNPRVDRDLDTICLKCLEKEPQRRYSSALKLAEDLQRYRRNEPIEARPVNAFERLKKWSNRNPVAAALVTVTALLLVALFAIVQSVRNEAALREAIASSDQGYQKALDTVDEIALFAERRLGEHPAELKDLLTIVLKEYGDFLPRRSGDPRFARKSAAVLTRVARILNLFGDRAEALSTHEKALQSRQLLVQNSPNDFSVAAELAETWHDIGILRGDLGHGVEAIAAYRKALEIRQDLVGHEPTNRAFLSDLARSHGYIGDWERESGHPDQASRSYDEALRIREQLFQADPSDLSTKFQLARSNNNNGHLERERGGLSKTPLRRSHLMKALDWHGKASQLQHELAGLDPAVAQEQLERDTTTLIKFTDFQSDLANTHITLGILWFELGQLDNAEAAHTQARTIFDRLVEMYPGVTKFQNDQAWASTHLGALRGSLDDLNAADAVFQRLLSDNPTVIRLRSRAAFNKAARGKLLIRSGGSPAASRARTTIVAQGAPSPIRHRRRGPGELRLPVRPVPDRGRPQPLGREPATHPFWSGLVRTSGGVVIRPVPFS